MQLPTCLLFGLFAVSRSVIAAVPSEAACAKELQRITEPARKPCFRFKDAVKAIDSGRYNWFSPNFPGTSDTLCTYFGQNFNIQVTLLDANSRVVCTNVNGVILGSVYSNYAVLRANALNEGVALKDGESHYYAKTLFSEAGNVVTVLLSYLGNGFNPYEGPIKNAYYVITSDGDRTSSISNEQVFRNMLGNLRNVDVNTPFDIVPYDIGGLAGFFVDCCAAAAQEMEDSGLFLHVGQQHWVRGTGQISEDNDNNLKNGGFLKLVNATQTNPPWGLARLSSRALPNYTTTTYYVYPAQAGSGVSVYILDSGIYTAHTQFGGRAVWGNNSIDTTNADTTGHGTHVAGTVGGITYGVAKRVKLIAVKVLGVNNVGTTQSITKGLEYVYNVKMANKTVPSVINMSLGTANTTLINDAVAKLTGANVTVVVAAGDNNLSACNYSPASAPSAITVAASDIKDTRVITSNTGSCVDLYAPGSNILSAWIGSTTASKALSGTSTSSPHVAGIAALYLGQLPKASASLIQSLIKANATANLIKNNVVGTPNLLANIVSLNSL